MTRLFNKFFQLTSIKRSFHSSALRRCTFDQGRTTMSVLNRELSNGFLVNEFSEAGFVISPAFNIVGPVIVFPRLFLSWNIAASSDMNEENLCLFSVIEPKLDVLVIGLDLNYPSNAPFLKDVRAWLQKSKINAEILPVHHAVSAYNFLANEGRFVAAALVPPKKFFPATVGYKELPKTERIPDY